MLEPTVGCGTSCHMHGTLSEVKAMNNIQQGAERLNCKHATIQHVQHATVRICPEPMKN